MVAVSPRYRCPFSFITRRLVGGGDGAIWTTPSGGTGSIWEGGPKPEPCIAAAAEACISKRATLFLDLTIHNAVDQKVWAKAGAAAKWLLTQSQAYGLSLLARYKNENLASCEEWKDPIQCRGQQEQLLARMLSRAQVCAEFCSPTSQETGL
eukprot:1161540-Pelagomonas_calceolata.AAC.6